MATWPSGTKASTANLDAGTDRPSLARPDIRQNVDNVNSVIDMFNIVTPTDNQILKYSTSNTRFELASLADNNTTYSLSAVVDGSNANIRLSGSDATTDDLQLVAGTGITVTVNSDGAIELDNTVVDTDTTYTISAETGGGGANLRLTDSGATTDDVLIAEGTGITVTRTDANTITIATTVVDTNTTYTVSAETDGANANLVLTGSDASTDSVQLVAGTNITLTVDSQGAVTIAATDTDTGITSVVAGTNIDVVENSAGGVTVSLESVVDGIELRDYKETVFELTTTSAGTINVDVADGPIQKINLTENVTFTGFVNAENGQSVTLILVQDGTGSRTFTESLSSASLMLFAGGEQTLTTAANSTDILSIVFADGIYYASLAKGFA